MKIKIKFSSVLFIFYIFILGCQNPYLKKHDNEIIKNKLHRVDSKDLKKYYFTDSIYSLYIIDTSFFKTPNHFNIIEINTPIKESEYYNKIKKEYKYYVLDSFNIDENHYKIIMYLSDGENDTKVMNIKLNSYNKENILVDALLLDQRFTFEIEYFRCFIISLNKNIDILRYEIDHFLYDGEGNILGENIKKDTIIKSVNYIINNDGKFIKKLN